MNVNEVSSENLPKGWSRDESGALRRETIHSMLRRLPGWDYSQRAIYQITITLEDRASQALGRLEVRRKGGEWLSVVAAKKLKIQPEEVDALATAAARVERR